MNFECDVSSSAESSPPLAWCSGGGGPALSCSPASRPPSPGRPVKADDACVCAARASVRVHPNDVGFLLPTFPPGNRLTEFNILV